METLRIDNEEKYLVSLEKIDKELHSIRRALHSHNYEPTTHRLFRRLQTYRRHVELLRRRNDELIRSLRDHKEQGLGHLKSHMHSIIAFRKRIQRYRANLRGGRT
ncbi:hypothetical protein ACFQ1M_07805 [Sungkyunkwania multivorans]|uniref:Uncharacterized protein n=1 Tax=Sungkyunkwania multivorans TaxID=1173618 RepID=A0ABW3CWG1_9FLAO